MLCKILLYMLLVNIWLANITEMAKQDTSPRYKPVGFFFKLNPKSCRIDPKAPDKVAQSCAKDVASEQIKSILSGKANLARLAADANLDRKRQLLDLVSETLAEKKEAMEEVQQAIVVRSAFMKTVLRIRDRTRQRLAKLQGIYKEEIDTMQRMLANAQQLAMEKRSLVDAATRRVGELHACMKKALADLDRNRDMAEKANSSAAAARSRIKTMPPEGNCRPIL
ncbi:hypothetical protein KR032_005693 [Drosophila birchii]|nr:hypothetical protein KR032_005693 [Drosophila birchii]